jgi:hypothetical protein
MFQAGKPGFLSFQANGWDRPNTKLPKRHETTLRLSFVMVELMGGEKHLNRPSLAAADKHPVPPFLPIGSFSASSFSQANSPIATVTSPSSKAKVVRSFNNREKTSPSKTLKTTFGGIVPGGKLANIPENSSFIMETPSRPFRDARSFQSLRPTRIPGSTTSLAGLTSTAGGTSSKGDGINVFSSQSSGYMPRTSGLSHGYGFSYSDSSDEDSQVEQREARKPIINTNTSFDDVVVMRDIAKDWTYTQPSSLPCTHAKLEYV